MYNEDDQLVEEKSFMSPDEDTLDDLDTPLEPLVDDLDLEDDPDSHYH